MTPFNINNKVCAIIVTYQYDCFMLNRLLRSTTKQVDGLVIVDNDPSSGIASKLNLKEIQHPIKLIQLEENVGIAAAHNKGIRWAMENGFTHVLLLDQDSIPADDMVERLSAALDNLHNQGKRVSAVGPRYVDPITGFASPFVRFGLLNLKFIYPPFDRQNKYISAEFLITSGSLISLDALDKIGLMDEGLFIGLVDTEWFLRARAKGFMAFGVPDAVMHHSLGDRSIRIWIGGWRQIPYHSPVRHYYIFRNSINLYRKKYMPAKWIINNTVQLAFMFLFFPIFTPPRFKHMLMMLKGLMDGFLGKMGPLNTSVG